MYLFHLRLLVNTVNVPSENDYYLYKFHEATIAYDSHLRLQLPRNDNDKHFDTYYCFIQSKEFVISQDKIEITENSTS